MISEPRAWRVGGRKRCFMLELSFPVSGEPTPRQDAVAGCHPLTVFGVLVIFLFDQGFRDSVAPPLSNLLRPLPWAMNQRRKGTQGNPACLSVLNCFAKRVPYRAALMMAAKESAFRAAPPTRAPSMSGWLMSSAALSGFTEPPYCRRTASAAAAPKASATTPRMKA